jgi:hypothetical protein
MKRRNLSAPILFLFMFSVATNAQSAFCPTPQNGTLNFSDAIAMTSGLAVNPDGSAASYMPGDHGYTYINNGVNLILDGKKVACVKKINAALCRNKWKLAEAGNFGVGTPEFCSFAIDVDRFPNGPERQRCEKDGRFIVGNGKGKPKSGSVVKNVFGESITSYLSTTSLRHTINDTPTYLDSSVLPGIVVPEGRTNLIGAIVWVRYGSRSTFAIVNDEGPSFGEGSIALHRALRFDTPPPIQPVGPIPVSHRCTAIEKFQPPFNSAPDDGEVDLCKAGRKPTSATDIRAYNGIGSGVQTIILPNVKPPMKGKLATIEITPAVLRQTALDAGYDEKRLSDMANCL